MCICEFFLYTLDSPAFHHAFWVQSDLFNEKRHSPFNKQFMTTRLIQKRFSLLKKSWPGSFKWKEFSNKWFVPVVDPSFHLNLKQKSHVPIEDVPSFKVFADRKFVMLLKLYSRFIVILYSSLTIFYTVPGVHEGCVV